MTKEMKKLRNLKSLAKLASLLPAKKWEILAEELKLPAGTNKDTVLRDPQLIGSKISRTRLLEMVLDEHGCAMSMLAEVMAFLDDHSIAARSTGKIATLPRLKNLKPQQRNILTQWTKEARKRWKAEQIKELWWEAYGELENLLKQAKNDSGPRRRMRWNFDYFNYYSYFNQEHCVYHEDILDLLCKHIDDINKSLPEPDGDELLEKIATKCAQLAEQCDDLSQECHPSRLLCSMEDYKEGTDKITILVERLRLMKDMLTNGEGKADLLAVAVFRNLPQLYEVWLLCFVLRTLENAGYKIKLEQLHRIGNDHVWNLKFAAARQPVASVGQHAWVFFQYKTEGKPTMPDLAIFDNQSASGEALIVIDAKFSELHGYSATDYKGTLSKYHGFGKKLLVVEYEDREDLKSQSGVLFGVRPDTPGAEQLKNELFCALVLPKEPAIAVIDVSLSFKKQLPSALNLVEKWTKDNILSDKYVLFAGNAEICTGLANAIQTNKIKLDYSNGTQLAPLKAKLAEIRANQSYLTILLVSDGKFQNGDEDVDVKELRDNDEIIWKLGI